MTPLGSVTSISTAPGCSTGAVPDRNRAGHGVEDPQAARSRRPCVTPGQPGGPHDDGGRRRSPRPIPPAAKPPPGSACSVAVNADARGQVRGEVELVGVEGAVVREQVGDRQRCGGRRRRGTARPPGRSGSARPRLSPDRSASTARKPIRAARPVTSVGRGGGQVADLEQRGVRRAAGRSGGPRPRPWGRSGCRSRRRRRRRMAVAVAVAGSPPGP